MFNIVDPIKCSAEKNTLGGIDVLLSIKCIFFFACKAIFIKQNMVLL